MDQSNNVKLRWNKHQATLMSVFDALLDNEKLTDCTISAEGRHLRAHKIILSACSPYFEELFSENNEKYPIIILHDVKYEVVKALMDFMYRGEVNVPQEELSGVLKLSDALQIRGLSGSGCADNVSMQQVSGRNTPSVSPETLPAQAASVSSFTSRENDPEGNVQLCKERSPTVLSQESGCLEVDVLSQSVQKYRKSIKHSNSDHGSAQNAFEEVITPDLDSVHQLPSQRQVLPTTCNSARGSVYSPIRALKTMLSSSHTTTSPSTSSYSPIPCQSVCNELQSSIGEMAVAENEQFSISEAVLSDKKSANLSAHQQEILLETKCEVLESHMEIVEDLTLDDDDDYAGGGDYRGDLNSSEVDIGEIRRARGGLTCEGDFRTEGINNLYSSFGSVDLNNVNLTRSQRVLPNRFSCHSCGNSYRYPQGLWRHIKFECGKEPQFQCPHCSYRCARSDHLKKHMASIRCQMQKKYALFAGGV